MPKCGDKYLAIEVEDHPWSYRNFDGVISSGYGKGTVKLIYSDDVIIHTHEPNKIKFDYNNKTYSLVRMKDKKWLLLETQKVLDFKKILNGKKKRNLSTL